MKQNLFSRRSLLQLLGMGAAASVAPGLLSRRAGAQSVPVPTRIVFFYTNHGSHRPAWLPVGASGAAAPTETAFELGELHQPLAKFKQDLLLVDGLDMTSSDVQTGPAANSHIRGHCHSLTGSIMADQNLAGGASIDQHIAQAINRPTPLTALPSLEIGVDSNGESRISFAAASQQLPIEGDPRNTYKRLFPNGPTPPSVEDKTPAQQKSILDFVNGEFSALSPKLGKEDRAKLDAHATAVRDLESRLGLGSTRGCTPFDQASLAGIPSRNSSYGAWYDGTGDAFMRLIQTAFACDLTRVVTFNMEAIPDSMSGYTGKFGTSDLHDLVHKVANASDPLSKDTGAIQLVKQFHLEYAKQFAKLLGYLKAIPESDGKTVLDHTIVLWCGEIAEGGHDLHLLPWVIGGGSSAGIRTGRYLELDRVKNNTWPVYSSGPSHNDLFVALANAMGSPITTFGASNVCKGPLAGLT
ncbi:MAG TPA: DUF1552 domain-containing protein [Polyangiaceae bacterium]